MAITCLPSLQQSRHPKVALWMLQQYESTISLLYQQHSFSPAHSFHLHGSCKAGAISLSAAAAIDALSGSIPTPIPMPQDAFPNPVPFHMCRQRQWSLNKSGSSVFHLGSTCSSFPEQVGALPFLDLGICFTHPSMANEKKPSTSGLGICWTLFQLFMRISLLADHKLLDHPQMHVPKFALNVFAQHPGQVPSSHHAHPQPHTLSPAAVTALERTPALQRPLCHSTFMISSLVTSLWWAEALVSLTINPCENPPSNSRVSCRWALADPHGVIKLTQRDCSTCTAH